MVSARSWNFCPPKYYCKQTEIWHCYSVAFELTTIPRGLQTKSVVFHHKTVPRLNEDLALLVVGKYSYYTISLYVDSNQPTNEADVIANVKNSVEDFVIPNGYHHHLTCSKVSIPSFYSLCLKIHTYYPSCTYLLR